MRKQDTVLFTSNSNLLIKEFYTAYKAAQIKIEKIVQSEHIHAQLNTLNNADSDLNVSDIMTIDIDLIKPTPESLSAQRLDEFNKNAGSIFKDVYTLYALCFRILQVRKSINALKWTQSIPSEKVFNQIGQILEDRRLTPAMRSDLEFVLEFVFEVDPVSSKASPESIRYFIDLTLKIINEIENSLMPAHILYTKKCILENFLLEESPLVIPFIESLRLGSKSISIYQARTSPSEIIELSPIRRSKTELNLRNIL